MFVWLDPWTLVFDVVDGLDHGAENTKRPRCQDNDKLCRVPCFFNELHPVQCLRKNYDRLYFFVGDFSIKPNKNYVKEKLLLVIIIFF